MIKKALTRKKRRIELPSLRVGHQAGFRPDCGKSGDFGVSVFSVFGNQSVADGFF